MLTQSYTHKSYKITSLTTDSYKQLFVLITMLLTVLSVQQSTFTMAAPIEQQQPMLRQQHNLLYHTPSSHHTQLHDILLAETNEYDRHHQHHHYRHQQHQQQQQEHNNNNQQQLETDLTTNEERLHKRQISWHDYYKHEMESQHINWYNPCGGTSIDKPVKRKPIKKQLRNLTTIIANNYDLMNGTLKEINIQNMAQWKIMEARYKFLPKLNINSTISLRRWHRQLQMYVAAFDYLRRAQLHFDDLRTSEKSKISQELEGLMSYTRDILCNLEHVINKTTTRKRKPELDALFINRMKMEELLKFKTDIKYVSPLKWHAIKDDKTVREVDTLDLKFTKSHYYSFIRKLIKILRIHTKQKGPIHLGNKGRKQQQQLQHQQQKPLKQKPQRNGQLVKTRHSKRKLE